MAFPHTGNKPIDSLDIFMRLVRIVFAITMGGSLEDEADDELLVIRWTGKDCTLAIPIKMVTVIKCLKLQIDILFDLFIIITS